MSIADLLAHGLIRSFVPPARIQQMLEGKANPEKLATKDDYVS